LGKWHFKKPPGRRTGDFPDAEPGSAQPKNPKAKLRGTGRQLTLALASCNKLDKRSIIGKVMAA
jgi:hypothetical protein